MIEADNESFQGDIADRATDLLNEMDCAELLATATVALRMIAQCSANDDRPMSVDLHARAKLAESLIYGFGESEPSPNSN